MGLFSRKKKLSKEEKETLEKARKQLKKIKDNENDAEINESKIKKESENTESPVLRAYSAEEINASLAEALENNTEWKLPKDNINWKILNDPNPISLNLPDAQIQEEEEILKNSTNSKLNRICCALDCDVKDNNLTGKECKFCNNFCCIDHLLCHKHDCVKDRHVKFIRKTWLRKYGQDISTGHYTVVCDVCGYVSSTASFIEIAGDERLDHISKMGCDSKKVFLEGIT